jgi:hypothetical protein
MRPELVAVLAGLGALEPRATRDPLAHLVGAWLLKIDLLVWIMLALRVVLP